MEITPYNSDLTSGVAEPCKIMNSTSEPWAANVISKTNLCITQLGGCRMCIEMPVNASFMNECFHPSHNGRFYYWV